MSGIKFTVPEEEQNLKPRITVIGVGGAGGNAVTNMIDATLEGCDFVVANTDAQALTQSSAQRRIQLGRSITQGLGAGARPETGGAAAEESLEEIRAQLDGSHMVFITAGMGGGTGTGAAPFIANTAKEMGILTVGVVTKPFHFEGTRRMRTAERGIEELQKWVDTLIIVPNQNLFRVANEKTTFADAFKMADDVLHDGVRSVTDLMMVPGLVNLDFADVRTVMSEMGKAMMGAGEASGEKRALEAAEAAIANPLLEDASMKGARAVLINITGGMDMALYEVDEAANRIREEVDPDANIIFGSTFDADMEGNIRVSVVATGIDAEEMRCPEPNIVTLTDAAPKPAPRIRIPTADPVAARAGIAENVADFGETFQPAATAAGTEERPSVSNSVGRIETLDLGGPVVQRASDRADTPPNAEAPGSGPILEQAPRPARPGADAPFVPSRGVTGDDVVHGRATPRPAARPAPEPKVEEPRRASLFGRVFKSRAAEYPAIAPRPGESSRPLPPAAEGQPNPCPPDPIVQPELHLDRPAGNFTPHPDDRPKLSREEDDLLEIPAFLRRQAN